MAKTSQSNPTLAKASFGDVISGALKIRIKASIKTDLKFNPGLFDRSQSFVNTIEIEVDFVDTAFASTVRAPGFGKWWHQFKPLFQAVAPAYVKRIDADSPPNMLEATPWFVPEDHERNGA